MITDDKMEALGELYDLTGANWVLSVNHILTEPVCPTVMLYPEGWEMTRYRVDNDTIEKGIQEAVDRVYQEVVLRKEMGHAAPYTSPHDKLYETWIKARIAGSEDWLPEIA